jgi:hypothetical protein
VKEKYTKAKMNIIVENGDQNILNAVVGNGDYLNNGMDPDIDGEIGVGSNTNTPPTFPDDD